PPELLCYVKEIESAKQLNAVHGKYRSGDQTILFNPKNLGLKQYLGKGDGPAISHTELCVVPEGGHSLYEHLTPRELGRWLTISGWAKGSKAGQAPPYVERRSGWKPFTSKWTHKF